MKNNYQKSNSQHLRKAKKRKINKQVLVFSIIGAIFLYGVIGINQRNEKVFSCRLRLEGLNSDYIITNNIPEFIKITVKDKQKVLDSITEEDFNVHIDLSKIKEANNYSLRVDYDLPKTATNFTNALLFSSIELNPTRIEVNIEDLIQKNVPILLDTKGSLPKGYTLKEKLLETDYVRIQGPKNTVSGITAIRTEIIDLSNEVDSFKRYVNLISPNPYVVFLSKSNIEATFRVVKTIETAVYSYDTIELTNLKRRLNAQYNLTNKIAVTVTGDKEVMAGVSKSSVIVSIDCSSISYPGEHTCRINVSVPQNVTLVSIKPDTVKLTITDVEDFAPPPPRLRSPAMNNGENRQNEPKSDQQ